MITVGYVMMVSKNVKWCQGGGRKIHNFIFSISNVINVKLEIFPLFLIAMIYDLIVYFGFITINERGKFLFFYKFHEKSLERVYFRKFNYWDIFLTEPWKWRKKSNLCPK